VLESTAGILRSWGCEVVTAAGGIEACERIDGVHPDLIIADFHLAHGENGVDVIASLRALSAHPIGAFLVSGDIGGEPRRAARAAGLHLLDKPLSPLKLRAMAMRMLSDAATEDQAASIRTSSP
jgi:CheY-like chemotaxis protein